MTRYLKVEDVVAFNARLDGATGVHDLGIVEGAVHRPQAGFGDVEKYVTLYAKAAALLHGLASTQGFSDGNKRTAWAATVAFLAANDEHLRMVEPIEAEAFVIGVAVSAWREDTVDKAAEWLEHACSDRTGATRVAPDAYEPGPVYRNRTVRVVDVITLPRTTVVDGVRFENCRLVGPAIVMATNVVYDRCVFHVDKHDETIVWDVQPGSDKVGAVPMVNCVFVECSFAQLGFAMTPMRKHEFLWSLNLGAGESPST